jgi:hypothetical protein
MFALITPRTHELIFLAHTGAHSSELGYDENKLIGYDAF